MLGMIGCLQMKEKKGQKEEDGREVSRKETYQNNKRNKSRKSWLKKLSLFFRLDEWLEKCCT